MWCIVVVVMTVVVVRVPLERLPICLFVSLRSAVYRNELMGWG